MRLQLSMLAWPDGAKPEIRAIDGETVIGRGRDSGWVLGDPRNQLSRRHCQLTPFGDTWRVTDLSLNGTFINDAATPLGPDQSTELHDGDRIRLGSYVIEARREVPAAFSAPPPEPAPFHPAPDRPFGQHGGFWQPGPADTPPSAPGAFADGFNPFGRAMPGDFIGPPSADHAPSVSDAWQAPPPGRVVLPEDWDLEPSPPLPAPPSPAAGPQLPEDWDSEAAVPPPVPSFANGTAPLPPAAVATPQPSPVGIADAALLAAFLHGIGLRNIGDADPVAMMEKTGGLLRVVVDRLRAVQVARAAVKREFRILATMVRPADNNPIKFSANTEAALLALLTGRQPADRAVAEVLDEIRLHELAMIAAMRDAVRELLETLSPARIRAAVGEQGLLPVQRKARAFEHYEALHARTAQALTDNFDSVFGRAFARAYERVALDDADLPGEPRP